MVTLEEKYRDLLAAAKKGAWGKPSKEQDDRLNSDIVDLILTEAVQSRASDIHIEPLRKFIRIRFRIDGKLYQVLEVLETPEIHLIPCIKILTDIPTDTVSSRKSWDGRFSMTLLNQQYDFRVATFPTVLGDKVSIRVLNKSSELIDLTKIGLRAQTAATLEQIIQKKNGLLTVSGPTGEGKTTTLYSILRRLHTSTVNIVTLENPVEYQIDGFNQCDINKKVSEDFNSALKATLRQDPDIILIGEIRDLESAEIALRASITGHLVLTSIHANSAVGTVARLINMGLERHMIAYAMIGSVSQHLVPRICNECRAPYTFDPVQFDMVCAQCGVDPKVFDFKASDGIIFYKGAGCEACKWTGYHGMIGIYEVIQFNEDLREAIINNASVSEIERIAVSKDYESMAVDALQKVKSGTVHFEDIYHIILEKSR